MKREERRKFKEFNTANISRNLTCDNCAHSWRSDKKPEKIKQGMIVIEDACPSCGEYISKCV